MSAVQFSSSINISGSVIAHSVTSSLLGTASFADSSSYIVTSQTASFVTGSSVIGAVSEAVTASHAISASYAPLPGSSPSSSWASSSVSASYVETAQTASFVAGRNVVGPLSGTFSGSSVLSTIIATSTLTASDAVFTTAVASSSLTVITSNGIEFQANNSGVRLGNVLTDNHLITGSVGVTGSFTVFARNNPEFRVVENGVTVGNLLTDNHLITGSVGVTGSFTVFSRNNPEFRVVDNGTFTGNASTDIHRITGSVGISGSLLVEQGVITGRLNGTASLALTASYFGGSISAGGPFISNVYYDSSYPQTQSIVSIWYNNALQPGGTVQGLWPVSLNLGGSGVLGNGAQSLVNSIHDNAFVALPPMANFFNYYAGISLFASTSLASNNYATVNYIVGDFAFNHPNAGCSMFLGPSVDRPSIYLTKSGSAVFGMPITRPNVSYNPSSFGDVPASQLFRLPSRAVFIGDARAGHNQPPAMEFSSNGNRSDWTAVLSMSGSDQFGCWTNPSNTGTTSFGFLTGWKVNTQNGRMAIGRTTGVTGTTNGYSNTTTHVLTVAGGVAGTIAYATLSDRRDKEDIIPIESGLDIVNRLNPVTYLSKYAEEGKRTPGYIAQDVLEVAPDVVHGDENGYMMSYESLTPYYAKAIQELSAENTQLRTTLEALVARIEALENK